MQTVGIDLAAQPAGTGICVVDWVGGRVVTAKLNDPQLGDNELVAAISGPGVVKCGIDAPLGWPDAFVDAVVSHHRGGPWPGLTEAVDDPDAHRRPLRLRTTDMAVATATGRHPMSVSADRIAVAAMRAAVIQHLVDDHRVSSRTLSDAPVDRSGLSGPIAEVYPAAALAVWGMDPTGYKGATPTARSRRHDLVHATLGRFGLGSDADTVGAMVDTDHLFDALVCAVVAKAVTDGGTAQPTGSQMGAARREGWIHVPDPQWHPGDVHAGCGPDANGPDANGPDGSGPP